MGRRFFRRYPRQLRMKTGLARTHLVLHPGETIRTPADAGALL